MKSKKIIFLSFFIIFIFCFMVISGVYAQTNDTSSSGGTIEVAQAGGGGNDSGGVVSLTNPLGSDDIPTLAGRVIEAVLGIVGSLALIMFIYGGVIWMTAAGNEQSVTKGKNIVLWATLGLVVIFSSYALVKFVISAIGA